MRSLPNFPQLPSSLLRLSLAIQSAPPSTDRAQDAAQGNRSQTSTGSPLKKSQPTPWGSLLKLSLWILFWLVLADIGINRLFAYPETLDQSPSSFDRYFDYGRSIEGKISRMVNDTVDSSDPIVAAGWIDPQAWRSLPSAPKDANDLLFAYYGMSFAGDISEALTELNDDITLRGIVGPSAPPNHSYAAYMADEAGRNADVVMIGVLTSSVQRMRSLSGTSWSYEHPAPYSYPYYQLNSSGDLVAVEPVISSASEFVSEFNLKGERWQHFQAQMTQYDVAFDAIVFNENWTDNSAILRLLRRGWANRVRQQGDQGLYDAATGFNPEASEIQTLKVMLSDFVATARAADQLPIILLISDSGYGDSLYKVLNPHLQSLDALSLSTHELIPSDNPSNFIDSGHFIPDANRKVAAALQEMIADAGVAPE